MTVLVLNERTMVDTHEPRLFPYKQHKLNIDGNQIVYVDEGCGLPLVLVHPLPASSFIYRNFIPVLKHHFRCIAFDAPGFGFSKAAADFEQSPKGHARVIQQILSQLDLQDTILYLHDTLGAAGLWAALEEQQRIKGLIIGTTFAWSLDEYPEVKRFLNMVAQTIPGSLILQIMMTGYFRNARFKHKGVWTPAEKEAYRERFKGTQRRNMQQLFRNVLADSDFYDALWQRLPELGDRPTFFPWGTEDLVFDTDWLERFETMFPNHQTLVIDGAHHFPQEHAPQVIVDGIIDWWANQKG